jgi:hypothetical protein
MRLNCLNQLFSHHLAALPAYRPTGKVGTAAVSEAVKFDLAIVLKDADLRLDMEKMAMAVG